MAFVAAPFANGHTMPIPRIHETGFDGVITEAGLALIGVQENEWTPAGSAVIIAPNLAITAKHVVDGCWRHFGSDQKLKFGDLHGDFGILAFQALPGQKGALWAVQKLWCSPHTDLAVLQLEPYSDAALSYRWRSPMLRVQPPPIGAVIRCFGYRGGKASSKCSDGRVIIDWISSPSTAGGVVVKIHHQQREAGMLNFPCFQTNAPFTHGMSGGPIFIDGILSGIICASGHTGTDGQSLAYGTILWPILATTLELNVQEEPTKSCFSVHDLATRGYIRVLDLDVISVAGEVTGAQSFGCLV